MSPQPLSPRPCKAASGPPGTPPPHSSGLVTQEPTLLPPTPLPTPLSPSASPAPDIGLDPCAPLHSNTTFLKFLSDPKPPQVWGMRSQVLGVAVEVSTIGPMGRRLLPPAGTHAPTPTRAHLCPAHAARKKPSREPRQRPPLGTSKRLPSPEPVIPAFFSASGNGALTGGSCQIFSIL